MAYRLKNSIAIGILVWGANQTGIVNDTRVVEPNPDGPVLDSQTSARRSSASSSSTPSRTLMRARGQAGARRHVSNRRRPARRN